MIKMIVCDIDGTLVSFTQRQMSEANKTALWRARDAGIIVTLATGRMYLTARPRVEELGIDAPVLASSGADIRENHINVLSHPIPDETLRQVLELAQRLNVPKYVFGTDAIFCLSADRNEEVFSNWIKETGGINPARLLPDMDSLLKAVGGIALKIMLWIPDDKLHARMAKELKQISGIDVVVGGPHNLEITGAGVTKGQALLELCERLEIDPNDVMAIGDSGNDVDMLRVAGLGIAVGNAYPEALEAADIVIGNCEDDAVADAVERFALADRA